jgi:hypothetical protein
MGALAEAMTRFAQPLLEATDGSPEQLQRALRLSQICWNLARRLPAEQRDTALAELQQTLQMDDRELEDFQRTVVGPMIRRHQEMFPGFPAEGAPAALPSGEAVPPPVGARRRRVEAYPGTGRNAPCPCGSGKKYKRCCGP